MLTQAAYRFALNPKDRRAERSAISFPGVHFMLRAGKPHSASHASHRTRITERDSWVPTLDLCCRRWRPAKNSGALRIASSVLHILSQTTFRVLNFRRSSSPRDRAKGSAGTFQRGKFPDLECLLLFRKRISQKLYQKFPHNFAGLTAHTKPGLTRGTLQI
jgi:hypothetical protein